MTTNQSLEEKISGPKRNREKPSPEPSKNEGEIRNSLASLQRQIGNRAVQRLLAQRSGEGPFALDDDTETRINRERGSGQPLDSAVQAKMSDATGQDFSSVKVHTGSESHALNQQLSAKAFTTGNDIFFREGAYDPNSGSGQELIAHELTHVVQQSSGSVGSGSGRMTVNAPGDAYEQEADSVAKTLLSGSTIPEVQRQIPDEEELLQKQELDEDEESDVR
jgi:hypothetical protein